jgi:hypothetical protein
MISDWSNLPDLHSLASALILIDRLQFLWQTIEQCKVSLALKHNALMTAYGYTYKGHDSDGQATQDRYTDKTLPGTNLPLPKTLHWTTPSFLL